jgi:hypothetical protein
MAEDLITFEDRVQPHLFNLRVPTFWLDKSASWFVLAESWFCLHSVAWEQAEFDPLVSALTKEIVRLVLDIVENLPLLRSYSFLKNKLLAAHQLTDYQELEKCVFCFRERLCVLENTLDSWLTSRELKLRISSNSGN